MKLNEYNQHNPSNKFSCAFNQQNWLVIAAKISDHSLQSLKADKKLTSNSSQKKKIVVVRLAKFHKKIVRRIVSILHLQSGTHSVGY